MRFPASLARPLLVAAALVASACGSDAEDTVGTIEGVIDDGDLSNSHVELPDTITSFDDIDIADLDIVEYDIQPPSGGDHVPIWANCGRYDEVVPDGIAVHTLEHGAVWFAHGPDVGDGDIDALLELAAEANGRALISPHPAVDGNQVVAVAWERRLGPVATDDPRLADFVDQFLDSPLAPEPRVTCQGGVGVPIPF